MVGIKDTRERIIANTLEDENTALRSEKTTLLNQSGKLQDEIAALLPKTTQLLHKREPAPATETVVSGKPFTPAADAATAASGTVALKAGTPRVHSQQVKS